MFYLIVFPCGEWPSTLDYFCRALQVHVSDCSCFCWLLQIRMPQPPTPHPRALWGAHRAPPGLPQGPFGPLGTDGASRRADGGGRTALRAAHKVFFVLSWETFSMSEVRMRNAELSNLAQNRSEYLNIAWRGREYPWMVLDCSEWSRLTQVGPELPNLD